MWYLCAVEYCSAIKNEKPAICNDMDEPRGIIINKTDTEGQILWFYLNVESRKQNEWTDTTKQKQSYRHRE